jgi:hypothetical protein
MNDRAGARGWKTKPPPAGRYLRRERGARAAHSPGLGAAAADCGWGPGRGASGRPAVGGTRARAAPCAPRGKQATRDAAARRMQPLAAAAAAPEPWDPALPSPNPRPGATTGELRLPEQSAPLSGSSRRPPQRAGSRLAFVLASSSLAATLGAPQAAPRRHHPRVTPRPPRDPPIVSSQRRGRAKPCLRPRSGGRRGPGSRPAAPSPGVARELEQELAAGVASLSPASLPSPLSSAPRAQAPAQPPPRPAHLQRARAPPAGCPGHICPHRPGRVSGAVCTSGTRGRRRGDDRVRTGVTARPRPAGRP